MKTTFIPWTSVAVMWYTFTNECLQIKSQEGICRKAKNGEVEKGTRKRPPPKRQPGQICKSQISFVGWNRGQEVPPAQPDLLSPCHSKCEGTCWILLSCKSSRVYPWPALVHKQVHRIVLCLGVHQNSVLHSSGEPLFEVRTLLASWVPDWLAPGSTSAKDMIAPRRAKRVTSPISAISWGPGELRELGCQLKYLGFEPFQSGGNSIEGANSLPD